jgi:hypothetical protein
VAAQPATAETVLEPAKTVKPRRAPAQKAVEPAPEPVTEVVAPKKRTTRPRSAKKDGENH